jgi:glycosyltransferase involved in cell wall biosynthesis
MANLPYMRILFLTDGLAPFVIGGMQQHSAQLVKHLAPLVESITLCHCGVPNAPAPMNSEVLATLGNPKNVQVIGLPFVDKGRMPGHYLRTSRRLSREYQERVGDLSQYDAIYAQGLMGDAFLRQHPKVLVNLHGLEMFQPGFTRRERLSKMLLRPIFRRQLRQSWKNVSLGGRLTDIIHQHDGGRGSAVVLPNGIAQHWMLSEEERQVRSQLDPARKLKYVMVGRNEFRKGLHVLQEALKLLSEPIELHMIGEWPRWDAGIHKVVFHGVVRDQQALKEKLDACDVLLLPSLSEGMPTVILEAMARGLDVIASDVGAVRELVKKPLPPRNSRALATTIQEHQLGRFNNVDLARYAWTTVAELTKDAFLFGNTRASP